MGDLISRSALIAELERIYAEHYKCTCYQFIHDIFKAMFRRLKNAPSVDAVEVVRCQNCIHAEPFDRHCELNTSAYMHCKLLRGEEVKYVWHKYKKYYKDYSVVDRDGFCDEGEPLNGEVDGE